MSVGPHVFPVRHHSPRASAVLAAFLDAVQPDAVLIEGPADATDLLDLLVDPETRPPVAILGYRTDGTPGSALWPFAAYSPEYVAARWARQHGRRAAFIDIPVGVALGTSADDAQVAPEEGQDPPPPGLEERCAARTGLRSFDEFWEAFYEAPAHDAASFQQAILAYADLALFEGRQTFHHARDAHMAAEIASVVASGVAADKVVAVVGAAHAAAIAAGQTDAPDPNPLAQAVPAAVTLIPYSYPRLAAQLGYGAGNRAPHYYQRAHEAGCDFRRATLEALIGFTEHLRLRGFMASLADTIEAFRLAVALAEMRGKAEPGLDEVREAAVATMCRGDAGHVDAFLWSTVVGKSVGQVASRIGHNSLQEEFWREVRSRRLPSTDAPEAFTLRLNNEIEVGSSTFLHRLRIAGVPYAAFQGTRGPAGAHESEAVGGYAALSRAREAWEAQWTPATDVALVERIVLGNSLQDVATRTLQERLQAGSTTGEAAEVLLESVIAGCPQTMSAALLACDGFAATDDDLPSLAQATRALSGLVAYGTSRARSELGEDVFVPLCQQTFARAVLRAPEACVGTDEAVAAPRSALRTLHDVALSQPAVDREAWLVVARRLVESDVVNATASGLACGLLYLAQAIDDDEVARVVNLRLSNTIEPDKAASFLSGFLEVNALVLVKSRPVVRALDGFLTGIDRDRFRDVLPILRRAFSALGATERRYLLENVLALRSLQGRANEAREILDEKDREKLKDFGKDMGKMLDDLDELL